jgi:hypothetical protein
MTVAEFVAIVSRGLCGSLTGLGGGLCVFGSILLHFCPSPLHYPKAAIE